MTIRRLGMLQWVGLLLGALVWAGQHVVGLGTTQAACSVGGAGWGIGNDVWQATMLGIAGLLVLGAEAASIAVLIGTRGTAYDTDPPPPSRIRFFALAALVANLLFLMIMLLDGFASIFDVLCRQG
ncbi:MAG TPA: hypothetical protein VF186_08950 [Gaiellaceae bacterium]|jgi:hypothetical protein